MRSETILLAETDSRTLDVLPEVLSAHIPHIMIETCTTAMQLVSKLEKSSYGALAVNPMLLHTYGVIKDTDALRKQVPLIVTVSQEDYPLAHTAFAGAVFDLIVKPVVPQDAVRTVQLAFWHNKLKELHLFKEQAASRLQQHRDASTHDLRPEEEFLRTLDTTYQTLQSSFGLLLNIERQSSMSEMVASIERSTEQLALDRLLNLPIKGLTH